MGPLWHFMEESMHWYGSEAPERTSVNVLQHPEWDWLAVAVATCSKDCRTSDESCVMTEHAVGFNLLKHHAPGAPQAAAQGFVLDGASTDASSELAGG